MADKENQKSSAPKTLSQRDALTAELGRDDLKEAQEKGYLGYVWQEDKTEYTATAVNDHDQTGPEKTAGTYDTDRAMEDHFIRPDKMEGNKKK